MSSEAVSTWREWSPFEQMRFGREILQTEGQALLALGQRLSSDFPRAVDLLLDCRGCVIVTGIGKAGWVAQKLSATLASTGTRSHFLHPAEAFHGDLGRLSSDDVVLALSQSGETAEVVRMLPSLRKWGLPILAVTARPESTLGKAASIVLPLGELREVCPLGLAPSTSTTAMLALGDALALVASRRRNFRREDFAEFHPGGSLGRKLSRVEDQMRTRSQCRVAHIHATVREVLVQSSLPGRRSGAILLVNETDQLAGIFTDSDLARLLERRRDAALDQPIENVMTHSPTTALQGMLLTEAVEILRERKLSELPVVEPNGQPVGLLDITDLLDLLPANG